MSTICVVGLGYIGLPTAALLAASGTKVVGVDTDPQLLEAIVSDGVYLPEPGLKELVAQVIGNNELQVSPTPVQADTFIIAVPTPRTDKLTCDLNFLISAVDSIIPYLQVNSLIIIESTVPPFTCQGIVKSRLESCGLTVGENVYLAHCPERVLPGNILEELIQNHRVIGGFSPQCSYLAAQVYKKFVKGTISHCDLTTAEMTKLVENTYRDVNIALVNELAMICNHLGADILQITQLANYHPRVQLMQPGPGVGGHCLAVDPYFIIEKAPHLSRLISTARQVNQGMPDYIVKAVCQLTASRSSVKVGVLGVGYKGNVDDTRESPALIVIDRLKNAGFDVAVYDPYVWMPLSQDIYQVFYQADLILILTDHTVFTDIDFDTMTKTMRDPVVLDTRNVLATCSHNFSKFKLYHLGNLPVIL